MGAIRRAAGEEEQHREDEGDDGNDAGGGALHVGVTVRQVDFFPMLRVKLSGEDEE